MSRITTAMIGDSNTGPRPHGSVSTLSPYQLYGIFLHSEIPLSFAERPFSHGPDVTLSLASSDWFSQLTEHPSRTLKSDGWYEYFSCQDGSAYLRWQNLFEFVVSPDGCSIVGRHMDRATSSSFETYLLGHVLSFAMVRRGLEPLHATVVTVDGDAIAFVGDSGFGKSTLAAAFLGAGHQLLTDDLLVVQESSNQVYACQGPPRIKLFPEIARTFLHGQWRGTPMNDCTEKLVIPLLPAQVSSRMVPLKAIYVLCDPEKGTPLDQISLTPPLSEREAFVELLRHTFNTRVTDSARLERQFKAALSLAKRVQVARLSYPRVLNCLSHVRSFIIEHKLPPRS